MFKRLAIPAVLVAYCLGAFLINSKVPLFSDDYWRAMPKLVTSIPGPLYMAWREYFGWSGRFVVTFFTYLLIGTQTINGGGTPMAVANSVVFATMTWLMYRTVTRGAGTFAQNMFVLTAACAMLYWLPQSIGEAAFWKTGAINYLWVMAAAVAFMMPFIDLLDLARPTTSRVQTLLWLLPGSFVAMGLEHVSVAVAGVAFLCVLYAWLKRDRAQLAPPIALFVIYSVMVMLLLFAPGNMARLSVSTDRVPLLQGIPLYFSHVRTFIEADRALLLALVAVSLLKPKRIFDRTVLVYLALSGLSLAAMVGAPHVLLENRTVFPTEVFAIIAILRLIFLFASNEFNATQRYAPAALLALSIMLLAFQWIEFDKTLSIETSLDATFKQRARIIRVAQQNHWETVTLPRYEFLPYGEADRVKKYMFIRDLASVTEPGQNGLNDGVKNATGVFPILSRSDVVLLSSDARAMFGESQDVAVLRGASVWYKMELPCAQIHGLDLPVQAVVNPVRSVAFNASDGTPVEVLDDKTGHPITSSCVMRADAPANLQNSLGFMASRSTDGPLETSK